ncbi:hypothetical protein DFS34DRAFT_591002 [Phlyctochytrium arcticum]|nr:hypothetical protein DFS34DRAFT_591002 [Phlyctochytrium arcticum]
MTTNPTIAKISTQLTATQDLNQDDLKEALAVIFRSAAGLHHASEFVLATTNHVQNLPDNKKTLFSKCIAEFLSKALPPHIPKKIPNETKVVKLFLSKLGITKKDDVYEIANTSLKTYKPSPPDHNLNNNNTIADKCISIITYQMNVNNYKFRIHYLLVEIGAMLGKDTFPGFDSFDDMWKAVEKDVKAATKTTMLAFIHIKDKKNFKSRCRNAFKLVDLLGPAILYSPLLVRDGRGSIYSRLTGPVLSEIVHIVYSSTMGGTNMEDSLLWWWKTNDKISISDVSKNTSRLTALRDCATRFKPSSQPATPVRSREQSRQPTPIPQQDVTANLDSGGDVGSVGSANKRPGSASGASGRKKTSKTSN